MSRSVFYHCLLLFKDLPTMDTAALAECENGELRLIGGADEREGNLQICFNQVWGSVCHDRGEFSTNEARVSCSQLGYNPSGTSHNPL